MNRRKSKLWLPFLLLLLLSRAEAETVQLFPIGEVEGEGWINVRRGEDAKAPIIGRVRKGETFAVQDAGTRYRILDGPYAGGYIATEFVRFTSQRHPLIKSMGKGVLVRAYPSSNGRVIASINQGAYFTGEKNGEWFEIKSGPFAGRFVSVTFVKPIEETGSAPSAAAPMVVTSAPVTEKGEVPAAKEKVSEDPPAENATAPDELAAPLAPPVPTPEIATKPAESTTSSNPETSNPMPAQPMATTPVAPSPTPTLAPVPMVGKLIGTNIRMRKFPGTNGKIAGVLKGNETLDMERQGDWYLIKSGKFKGNFVKADFVQPSEATSPPVNPSNSGPAPGIAAPNPEPIAQPDDSPAPVPVPASAPTQLPPATTVPGAPSPALTVTPVATTGKLIGTNIRMRKAPGTNGKIAGVLKGNETLDVEKQGDWYLIKSGKFKGNFVKADFVQPSVVSSEPSSPLAAPANASAGATPPTAPPPQPPPPVSKLTAAEEQRFEQQVEKLFAKKKNTLESNQVLMPVIYEQNKSPSGHVFTQVNASGLQVDAVEFFKLLRKHIAQSWFEKEQIKAVTPKEGATTVQWMTLTAFADTGVNIYFDEPRLEIHMLVPPEMRAVEDVSVLPGYESLGLTSLESQRFLSSYLNINATETFDSRLSSYADRRSPLQAQLENGTNIGNFVLEAFGTYTEERKEQPTTRSAFIRQDVRVTRDFPGLISRASVGDVVYPVQSFQVYRPMKGAAFYRQYAMAPSKLTYPTGNREIFLKNKSKVFIWVNDQLQKTVELPAGRHQIKDFQYTSGMNDVRFEIVDEFGQTEVVNYSYTASSDLLKPGFQQFSYAAGQPATSDLVTAERSYTNSNDTFSAFHRYGFTDYFTGGVNGQMDSKQSVFGFEGNFSLKKGYLRVETAYSNTESVGTGYAAASQYNLVDYKGPEKTQRSLNTGLVYRSNMFSEFGTTIAPAMVRTLNLVLGLSRGISKSMSLNFGANYTLNTAITEDASNSYQLRFGLSNRWKNGLSANATAGHSKLNSGKDEISISAFLIWSFPKEKQTISAYGNTADSSSRIGWNYNPSTGADSVTYQANVREAKLEKGYAASAIVNGNHARMAATHEVVLPKVDDPGTAVVESERASNVTTLQMGTAVVFAGGYFGLGRPVTDSFAIIAPRKSLKGQKLMVNPDSEGNYIAQSDWLGPAVMPELSSYNPNTLVVGAKDLPLGVSIPQDHFNLYPRYKSGYAFPLGNDANVYLVAQLNNSKGEPIGMASGLATSLDDNSAPAITVFTTRKGVMQSEGFKAGRYRVEIAVDKYEAFEITIPNDAKEEYNVGTQVLKDRK